MPDSARAAYNFTQENYRGMTNETLEKIDPDFEIHLKASIPSVLKTAEFLFFTRKLNVILPAIHIRATGSEAWKHKDGGDLFAISPIREGGPYSSSVNCPFPVIQYQGQPCALLTIEVKQREKDFSGLETYPYKLILVDNARGYDKHKVKPYCYFIWSHDLKAFCIVDVNRSREFWSRSMGHSHKTSRSYENIYCPKTCPGVTFYTAETLFLK